MSFSARPYHERFTKLGDTSELVFEDVFEGTFERFGARRPPFNVSKQPLKMRYRPDYLQEERFVEVVAMGNDSRLKMKCEKVQALINWQRDMHVDLFVWDGGRKRNQWGICSLDDLFIVCCLDGEGKRFHSDGKPHWSIPRLSLPVESWHKYEGELQ